VCLQLKRKHPLVGEMDLFASLRPRFLRLRPPWWILVLSLGGAAESPPAGGEADDAESEEDSAASGDEGGVDDGLIQDFVERFQRPGVGCEQADLFHPLREQFAGQEATAEGAEHQNEGGAVGGDLLIGADQRREQQAQ
jgi:hypothetical protein